MERINIQEFNRDKDVMKLERMFNNSSVLSIVGVDRKEIRHSRFLEWLFNQQEINTSDLSSPIMHLLDVIIRRDESQNPDEDKRLVDSELSDGIVSRSVKIKDLVAIRELKTDGVTMETLVFDKKNQKLVPKEMTGSIDILIKFTVNIMTDGKLGEDRKVAICIENKAFTEEHDLQTWKYYAYLTGSATEFNNWKNNTEFPSLKIEESKTAKGKFYYLLFVYLKPSANAEMENMESIKADCKCPHYVHINYQDVVDEILTPILNDEETPEAFLRHINQYVDSLGLQNDDIEKGAMAYKRNVMELSFNVWERYKELLNSVFKDDSIGKAFRDSHRLFLANLFSVIEMSTTKEDEWLSTQYYRLRLSGKNNYFWVQKSSSEKKICNQSELAVEFAKEWFEKKYDNSRTIDENIKMCNEAFSSVKNPKSEKKLFTKDPKIRNLDNDKTSDLYVQISAEKDVYFEKDCWNKGGYLDKLIDLISMNDFNFAIKKSPKK